MRYALRVTAERAARAALSTTTGGNLTPSIVAQAFGLSQYDKAKLAILEEKYRVSNQIAKRNLPTKVEITETATRDGCQGEQKIVPKDIKVEVIKRFLESGIRRIELGSYSNLPQMATTTDLVKWWSSSENIGDDARGLILVMGNTGIKQMKEDGVSGKKFEIWGVISASEDFQQRNVRKSVEETIAFTKTLMTEANRLGVGTGIYVSGMVACPVTGKKITPEQIADLVTRLEKECRIGEQPLIQRYNLSDTTGEANYNTTSAVVGRVKDVIGVDRLGIHLHDPRGLAVLNVMAALEAGVHKVDTGGGASLGSGCPAGKAAGPNVNIGTEDVITMLHGLGINTGVNVVRVAATSSLFLKALGVESGSKVHASIMGELEKAKLVTEPQSCLTR